ncbi:MAG: CapA family protein [Patescibacteria group bacterium]
MKRAGTILLIFAAAFSLTLFALNSQSVEFRTLTSQAGIFQKKEEIKTATVLFVGDMMFDRYIRTVLARNGNAHVLGGVGQLLAEADMNVGNLEGPITDNPSQSQGTAVGELTNMRFTFAPSVRKLLLDYGFSMVSIGNNHIQDFGTDGARSTTKYLSGAGIEYVGDPTGDSIEPVIQEVNGIRLAFVSYSDFVGGDSARARQALESDAAQSADAVIVLAHWGSEYETAPPARVRELARAFANAGADLIIGTHSHVVGEVEDIGNTRVYYSLGNFVFDQYWTPSVRCGLAVTATFIKEGDATNTRYAETNVGMRKDGATALGCS